MPVTEHPNTAQWRSINAHLHRLGQHDATAGELVGVYGSAEWCAAAIVERRRAAGEAVKRRLAVDPEVAGLRAEVARLRAALAPFATVGQGYIEVGEALVGDDCPTARRRLAASR